MTSAKRIETSQTWAPRRHSAVAHTAPLQFLCSLIPTRLWLCRLCPLSDGLCALQPADGGVERGQKFRTVAPGKRTRAPGGAAGGAQIRHQIAHGKRHADGLFGE